LLLNLRNVDRSAVISKRGATIVNLIPCRSARKTPQEPNPIASGGKVWQNIDSVPQRPAIKISIRQQGAATILDLIGDITLFNSPEIRKALIAELKENRVPYLLVNMLGVPYIDSSGVASLVEGLKISRDLNSRFALYGLSKSARTVLELTHLLRVFEVHQTEREALEAPQPPPFGSAAPRSA
jgi:anti-sigma B factor antagonist